MRGAPCLGFERVFRKFVPWWRKQDDLIEQSWRFLSAKDGGNVSFQVRARHGARLQSRLTVSTVVCSRCVCAALVGLH